MEESTFLNKIIENTGRKIESSVDIFKKEAIPEPFILDSMIPEKAITALTANSGRGKSLLALAIAGAIASGDKLFDIYNTKKKKTLILNLEMSENDIIQRVHSVFWQKDIPDVSFYTGDFHIDDGSDYKWLEAVIKKNKFEFLIIDTLSSFHGKEENSSSEMREINKRMLKLIRDTGCTILFLHHHRKAQQGESYSQASSRGSTEILAKVASHLLLDSKEITIIDEKGNDLRGLKMGLTQPKVRLMKMLLPFAVDVWNNPFSKKTLWKYAGEITEKSVKVDAKKFVLDVFKDGGVYTVKELMEERDDLKLNFGEYSLRGVLKDLVGSGILVKQEGGTTDRGGQRGAVYSLKSAVESEPEQDVLSIFE